MNHPHTPDLTEGLFLHVLVNLLDVEVDHLFPRLQHRQLQCYQPHLGVAVLCISQTVLLWSTSWSTQSIWVGLCCIFNLVSFPDCLYGYMLVCAQY